jgi:hypothetical protein
MMASADNDITRLVMAAGKSDGGRYTTDMEERKSAEQKSQEQKSTERQSVEQKSAGQKSQAQKSGGRKSRPGYFRGLLSGTLISDSLILKDMRYSALVVLLAVIFIANRFNAERVEREIIVLEQEVRDMRSESLSVSAELGSVSRQSEIIELVKERGLGLQELREPPFRIVVHE